MRVPRVDEVGGDAGAGERQHRDRAPQPPIAHFSSASSLGRNASAVSDLMLSGCSVAPVLAAKNVGVWLTPAFCACWALDCSAPLDVAARARRHHRGRVEAGDRRADRAEQAVGHPAGVLVALVPVEQVEEVPEPVLQPGRVRRAQRGLGLGADERDPEEDELHLPGAHVFLEERRQRVQRELAAEGALRVGELDQRHRRGRPAEDVQLLRDAAKSSWVAAAPGTVVGSVGPVARATGRCVAGSAFLLFDPTRLTRDQRSGDPACDHADGGEQEPPVARVARFNT